MGICYARKVFLDGFFRHRRGFEVHLPSVPLGRFYGCELRNWLDRHGVKVNLQQAARKLLVDGGSVSGLELRNGERRSSDFYVCTVPFARFLDLLPEGIIESHTQSCNLDKLETSPIVSVHLWYRSP